MKNFSQQYRTFRLLALVMAIGILAHFTIPIVQREVMAFKTKFAVERLALQLARARQAAVEFGHRSHPLPPIRVYLYPAHGDQAAGIWFDLNNSGLDPSITPPPTDEICYLPAGIDVGKDLTSGGRTADCASAAQPFTLVEFNSRGEIPPADQVTPCLIDGAATGLTSSAGTVNIYVEAIDDYQVIAKYLVSISLRGHVTVTAA